jgi:hypothetical protein
LHEKHAAVHVVLQQYPSTHNPDRQSLARLHVCPFVFLHPPLPSHAFGARHVGSVCPDARLVHVPRLPARLHAWHVPAHVVEQHTPSMQLPDAHCVPAAHA